MNANFWWRCKKFLIKVKTKLPSFLFPPLSYSLCVCASAYVCVRQLMLSQVLCKIVLVSCAASAPFAAAAAAAVNCCH